MQVVYTKVVTSSSVASPKFFGRAKYYDLKRATVFCLDDIACQSTKWQDM